MNDRQNALYELMSDISEECYYAGWMSGNEYTLWEMVVSPDSSRRYGQGDVSDEQIEQLRAFADELGGWIRWRDDEDDPELPIEEWGAVFTPMAEWLPMYEKRIAQMAALRKEIEARGIGVGE